MLNPYKVRLTEDQIAIQTPYSDVALCRAVPLGRYSSEWKCWLWPRGPGVARALIDAFGSKLTKADGADQLLALVEAPEIPPGPPVIDPGHIPGLKTTPWKHQREAYGLASSLPGAMLAMGMGTGKSVVGIALLSSSPISLILCPKAVISVWPMEFAKHASVQPNLVLLNKGTGESKARIVGDLHRTALVRPAGNTVVILNYEAAWREPLAEALLKIPWHTVIMDECLAPGTLIDTPHGAVPIERLSVGDAVYGVDHDAPGSPVVETTVKNTFCNSTHSALIDICGVRMTPNHPVYTTERGYIRADNVNQRDTLVHLEGTHGQEDPLGYVYLRGVRSDVSSVQAGREVLLTRMPGKGVLARPAGGKEEWLLCQDEGDSQATGRCGKATEAPALGLKPIPFAGCCGEGTGDTQISGPQDAERGQWQGSDGATADAPGCPGARVGVRACRVKWEAEDAGISDLLQAGHCTPGAEGECRGGWCIAQHQGREGAGCEARCSSHVEGVENSSRPEPSDTDRPVCRPVFNIETGTGNYFAAGLLVHNCHKIKSASGKASKFCARLRRVAQRMVGLTGTPMPHSPVDLYAQYRALDPRVFGTNVHSFKQHYTISGGFGGHQILGYQNQEEMRAKFMSIAYQADRSVIELPDATHTVIPVELGPKAMKTYKGLANDLHAAIEGGECTAANALVKLLRLQQLTGGYLKLDDVDRLVEMDTGKREALAELLESIGTEPVVVFCRFRSDMDAVHLECKALGLTSGELSGRQNDLAAWQKGEGQVIAVQIQSGGVGVDLTRASYCVYYSLGFSLGDYDQSLARVHRPGQKNAVSYYHLIVEGTVDRQVYDALDARRDVVNTILEGIKSKEHA